MNKENVPKRRWFNRRRADVHNAAQSGCPSVITEDLKERTDAHIHENRQFTTDEIREVFPYVSRSVLYETVTVLGWQTNGYLLRSKRAINWLNGLVANFYDEETVKLVQRLDKCPNHNDYTEK
jgi:hypothetical protein